VHASGEVRSLATGVPEEARDETELPDSVPDEAFQPRELSASAEGPVGVPQDVVEAALQTGQQAAGPFWPDKLL